MKNIRSAIAAGLVIFGGASIAAAQAAPVAPAAPHAHGPRGANGVARGEKGPGKRAGGALLRGIKLSDAEKTNLKNVRAKYEPQMKALREQFKPAQGKIARGDTAAIRARRAQNQPGREQMRQLMLAERADIRAALSAENQAKFDANVKAAEARFANRGDKNGKRAGRGPRVGK